MLTNLQNIRLHPLRHFVTNGVQLDVLRLDLLHPVVSGNKWFKLRYYLEDAKKNGKKNIATFGGPYSNHIVATAFAAREAGLKSIGYIRGEEPAAYSPGLLDAMAYGMQLEFLDRNGYAEKARNTVAEEDTYLIPEGGYGIKGAEGAATIVTTADTRSYNHILCACGTGTMLAGLIRGAHPGQQVTGISVLKNNFSIQQEVEALLTEEDHAKHFQVSHDYHFGGYAKHPGPLLDFMKSLWEKEQLPTDIVYTSKLLYAAIDLQKKGCFTQPGKVLIIHSGGLQGNRSLPAGSLPF